MASAGNGDGENLTGVEAIGIAQLGIGLGDARPGSAAAQLGSGDFPEGVAALDGDA
jgi:hypothetical protein